VVAEEEEEAEVVVGSTTYTCYVVLLDQTWSICCFLDNMYGCLTSCVWDICKTMSKKIAPLNIGDRI
jgi:hypothetical protein